MSRLTKNYKLAGLMIAHSGSIRNFANVLGLSHVSLSQKLNYKGIFKMEEMRKIIRVLKLGDNALDLFSPKIKDKISPHITKTIYLRYMEAIDETNEAPDRDIE